MREKHPDLPRVIDWGAIVAGFFVAFVLLVLLGLIAFLIGGATVDPLVYGAIAFVSLLCGGWVAGYFEPANGILHGIMVAMLAIIAAIVVIAVGPTVAPIFGLPAGFGDTPTEAATTLLTAFVINLIGGAIGGYLGELTARRPEVRS